MTTRARDLVDSFNALSPADKQQVAAEILRRSVSAKELPDEAFDQLAAEVFQSYDAEEATGAGH